MSKDDFDLFWRTHLVTSSHECSQPEMTVLYWHTTKEDTSNFPWTRREGTSRSHANSAAARDIITQVRVATKKCAMTTTLIQNYSPCFNCAEEIIKIVDLATEKRIKIDIHIAFVALNKIRRPSWIWRGMESAFHEVALNESNDNCVALRKLHEAGVKLSTFTLDTWRFMYTFLGKGLPVENCGKLFGGKCANVDLRLEEDRFMEADLKQILIGFTLILPSNNSSNSTLDVKWIRPALIGQKVSEYRIVCKKVAIKNKDDDEPSWRILQTLDKVGSKVTVSGEVTFCTIDGLVTDSFYDVTVEAVVKGLTTLIGRKLLKTANKVTIPALQAPTAVRRLSSFTRPRTASVTTPTNSSASGPSVRLKRSNSMQSASPRGPVPEINQKTKASPNASSPTRCIAVNEASFAASIGDGHSIDTSNGDSQSSFQSNKESSLMREVGDSNNDNRTRISVSVSREASNRVRSSVEAKSSKGRQGTSSNSNVGNTAL